MRALAMLKRQFAPKPEWLKKKLQVDREFDAMHGVDTGGYTYLDSLKIKSRHWREGNSHIAADPEEFASAVAALDTDLSRLTFIDLGSGKGRALLLAAQYPFKRIIGVEFSERLVEISRRNLGDTAETVLGDATEYDLPPVPTLLFLYNPFGRSIMDAVAEHTRASLEHSPRELIVLYLNPFHADSWLEAGFAEVRRGAHFSVIKLSSS